MALVVAIDGPSGSGKSSVARAVARRLRLAYLDTGAMYRAATWWCLDEGANLTDEAAVADLVRRMPLVMGLDPAAPTVHVGGVDVAAPIRETWVSEQVSALATNRGDHFRHTNMVAGLNGGDNHPIPGMTTFIFGTVFRN